VDVPKSDFPKAPERIKYVSEFIVNTKYENIPQEVVALGKKTTLDSFGLAVAGSASIPGSNIRKYIAGLGCPGRKASIIGTEVKAPPRFAALANGISIHADDYDDTGSGMHVAAPVLPAAFAICETVHRNGKDLMLAFHVGVEVENKIAEAISSRHDEDGFPYHRHLWIVWRCSGSREVAWTEFRTNGDCPGNRGSGSVGRAG
jgi:2-methylcitrate dehydratase PrpD